MTRRAGYALLWVLAAALAVAVGLVAVSTVGAGIRGRGPLGPAVQPYEADTTPTPVDTSAPGQSRTIRDFWGSFEVVCHGSYATGIRAVPAQGWRVVSYEAGPDDDVDAVFSRAAKSVDLEVYCNRGVPTVGDVEVNTLPDGD